MALGGVPRYHVLEEREPLCPWLTSMAGMHPEAEVSGCSGLIACIAAGGFRRNAQVKCLQPPVSPRRKVTVAAPPRRNSFTPEGLEVVSAFGQGSGPATGESGLSRKSTRSEMNLSTTLPLAETFPQVMCLPSAIRDQETLSRQSSVCSTKAVKRVKIVDAKDDDQSVASLGQVDDLDRDSLASSTSSTASLVERSMATQKCAEQLGQLAACINALQEHREKTRARQQAKPLSPATASIRGGVTPLATAHVDPIPHGLTSPVLSPTPKTRTRHIIESFCMDEVPRCRSPSPDSQ